MTGRIMRIWADTQRVHVLAAGHRVKTLPSRLDARDLTRLRANGAVPVGAPPLPPPSGGIIEIERTVNASGNISVGNHVISAGSRLAGRDASPLKPLRPTSPVSSTRRREPMPRLRDGVIKRG